MALSRSIDQQLSGVDEQVEALAETRRRTLELVSTVDDIDLRRVVTDLLSPLLWDLGHIASFERRWLLDANEDSLAAIYDPFAQPRAVRGDLSILERDECFEFMDEVRQLVSERVDRCDPFKIELVIQHEQQHNETMLQLLRMLDGYEPPAGLRAEADSGCVVHQREWLRIPTGSYAIGTPSGSAGRFAYDNESDRHKVDLAEFEIASTLVTNGEFVDWIERGGYERSDEWSEAGINWRTQQQAVAPLSWQRGEDGSWLERRVGGLVPLNPQLPVVHVSWFEADAFAREVAARLPSEFEWEAATGFGEAQDGAAAIETHAIDARRANLDHRRFGTALLGADAAVTASGMRDVLGQVWEWTSSRFDSYPNFEPFCYSEYSAPFFGGDYRVLRGGSWATRPRTVTTRFRNWDLPQRRQIFSGLRLVRSSR